jgi:hypothetical protein
VDMRGKSINEAVLPIFQQGGTPVTPEINWA